MIGFQSLLVERETLTMLLFICFVQELDFKHLFFPWPLLLLAGEFTTELINTNVYLGMLVCFSQMKTMIDQSLS
jgi:hypothetical protein